MTNLQKAIQLELGVKENIHPQEEITTRVQFLKNYIKETRTKGLVLGISGGQDSTLAGKLSQLAVNELKEEGYPATFIAVRLPHGEQKDEADAQLALTFIGPDGTIDFDIESTVNAFTIHYNLVNDERLSDFHRGNVKARTRMMTQYAIAGEHNLLVVGTDHAAEAVTGFFTKYGDGGADILPLSGLTKRQGKALLQTLNAPEALYLKKPTADLLDNKPAQADEDELGILYDEIDDYLEGKPVSKEVQEKLEARFTLTRHKRTVPVTPFDTWWK